MLISTPNKASLAAWLLALSLGFTTSALANDGADVPTQQGEQAEETLTVDDLDEQTIRYANALPEVVDIYLSGITEGLYEPGTPAPSLPEDTREQIAEVLQEAEIELEQGGAPAGFREFLRDYLTKRERAVEIMRIVYLVDQDKGEALSKTMHEYLDL